MGCIYTIPIGMSKLALATHITILCESFPVFNTDRPQSGTERVTHRSEAVGGPTRNEVVHLFSSVKLFQRQERKYAGTEQRSS